MRPTSSIKREAVFSIIESYSLKNKINIYKNKIFLDLFSGIGTMGLEAISRGIKKVIFYENNSFVIEVLRKNCEKFCDKENFLIINEDVNISNIDINFKDISIIYVDPPYLKYDINKLLANLQNKVNKNCVIAVETSFKDSFIIPNKLKLIKNKKYGKTNIYILVLS